MTRTTGTEHEELTVGGLLAADFTAMLSDLVFRGVQRDEVVARDE